MERGIGRSVVGAPLFAREGFHEIRVSGDVIDLGGFARCVGEHEVVDAHRSRDRIDPREVFISGALGLGGALPAAGLNFWRGVVHEGNGSGFLGDIRDLHAREGRAGRGGEGELIADLLAVFGGQIDGGPDLVAVGAAGFGALGAEREGDHFSTGDRDFADDLRGDAAREQHREAEQREGEEGGR